MAIAFVNANSASGDSGSTTLALPAINAVAGNAIVVSAYNTTGAARQIVSSVTDTAGNTYAQILDAITGVVGKELWLAQNINGHATNVVTITFAGSASYRRGCVMQLSGVATSGAHDTGYAPTVNTADSTSPYTTASDTTAEDNEWVIGFFTAAAAGTITYGDSGSNVMRVSITPSNGQHCLTTLATTTAGSYAAEATGSSSYLHLNNAFALKVAASAPSFTLSDALGVTESVAILASRSAAVTGTATASIDEADVVAGDKTVIITISGDEWIPS